MKLIIENLNKCYEEDEVLRNINFTFEEGKIYGLIGRNGAGKTTLFNSINKDIDINSGSFYIEENNNKEELDTSDIGYVISTPTVPEFLTAREFLTFFIDINKNKIKENNYKERFCTVKFNM